MPQAQGARVALGGQAMAMVAVAVVVGAAQAVGVRQFFNPRANLAIGQSLFSKKAQHESIQ